MIYIKASRFCSKISSSLYIKWNKIFFFLNNIKYGKNFRVFNHLYLRIHLDAVVQIGDNCTITSGSGVNPLSRNIKSCVYVAKGATLKIGNGVGTINYAFDSYWYCNGISICRKQVVGTL